MFLMCQDLPVKRGTPHDVAAAMEAALDDVVKQIGNLSVPEIVGEDDLEWSFDAPRGWSLFVEGEHGEPTLGVLPMRLTVHTRRFHRHDAVARAFTIPIAD